MPVLPNPVYQNHRKFNPEGVQSSKEDTARGLAAFLPAFERNYREWLGHARPDYDARIVQGDEALAAVQRDGFAFLKIREPLKAELVELAMPSVAYLEEKLRTLNTKPKFRDMNLALNRAEHPRIYDLMNEILDHLAIPALAAAYMRRALKIKKLFVQVNTAAETAARYGSIEADGLPALKTDYWHIDSDIWPNIKILIYLNDVDFDQGPLRYVSGSHRIIPDFEMLVRKTNDFLKLPTSQFVALPEELRLHALFGPYLRGDEPAAMALLRREKALYGPAGDLTLFDNNGVHRGGFVRQGSRYIVQCLFEAASPTA